MTLYRTNFGPMDDGSTDTEEAHEAWMEVNELVKDGWLVSAKPTYYQNANGTDPEDVLIAYLVERGVDKENAYDISHHLVHTVLYSVPRAVKRARAEGWEAAMSQEHPPVVGGETP